jgi:hypothetical protein
LGIRQDQSSGGGFHKMTDMEATGHNVVLYSSLSCFSETEVGQVTKDGTCYSAPSNGRESFNYSYVRQ